MKSVVVWHSVAKCGIVAMWLCAGVLDAHGQTQPPPPPNQPIELPEFIVTGKESVNIPGGTKREPLRPPVLRSDKLDSLNPIEKLPLPRLPSKPLPEYKSQNAFWPGYLEAEFGNYITPKIAAGFSLQSDGYLVDMRGNLEASSGWIENSEYLTAGIGATSTYVAPEKFLVFGGSTTLVDVDLDHRSYNLFAASNTPARTTTAFYTGVETTGEYDGVSYDAAISWRLIGLNTDAMSTNDHSIVGRIAMEKHLNVYDVGALLDVRIRSFGELSYPYTVLTATGGYSDSTVTLKAKAGAQWAGSTLGIDRFGALLEASGEIRMGPQITMLARVQSGLRSNSLFDLLSRNPYISDSTTIDATYDVFDVRASMQFHPTMRLTASFGFAMRSSERDIVWIPSSVGMFEPDYKSTSTLSAFGDVRWLVSASDAVVADLSFTNAIVSEAAQQPYVPTFQASAGYDRTWSHNFQTVAALVYVGDRWADIENTNTLSGYVDVRLSASFLVGRTMRINARTDNLLGSSIMLWQGYRERGIFVSAGITLTF